MPDFMYFQVHDLTLADWEKVYYPLNVAAELEKMKLWLDANPRRRKKNYYRFVTNWLNKTHAKIQSDQIQVRMQARAGAYQGRAHLSASDLEWQQSVLAQQEGRK